LAALTNGFGHAGQAARAPVVGVAAGLAGWQYGRWRQRRCGAGGQGEGLSLL